MPTKPEADPKPFGWRKHVLSPDDSALEMHLLRGPDEFTVVTLELYESGWYYDYLYRREGDGEAVFHAGTSFETGKTDCLHRIPDELQDASLKKIKQYAETVWRLSGAVGHD